MDDDFLEELVDTFILEFEELMALYRKSLHTLRRTKELNEERQQAYADLFRIYHTLKGDSGYFPEYENFTNFTSDFCERLRSLDDSVYDNEELLYQIRLNYTRLSSALHALRKGKSINSFRYNY